MIRKNEKGFALVLSLVLMLAMSLMGGALIVMSASDHQSNNKSDEYQQTFYVAETALLEGEKYVLNQFLGPWNPSNHKRNVGSRNLPSNKKSTFNGQMQKINYSSSDKYYFNTSNYCFNSFPDKPDNLKVVVGESWNFGDVIRDSFNNNASQAEKDEAERLKGYYYEYFITRIGSAPFKGSGSSIKKSATDTAADGGGFILKGTPVSLGGVGDKTFLYDHSRTKKYFVSSENIELANGKEFAIGNQLILSGTTLGDGVVNSSLTSVGVLVGATGQPALETDGAHVLGGRVIEKTFGSMATGFSLNSNTLTVITAAANTICGETTTANQAINTWAFNTADPDGTVLANGQSITITLIIDASTASTYGDDCTVDGNIIPTGVRWSGGSPPVATSNTDILTFLIVKDSAGVTRVYGQGNTDFS